jgi:hypothetical protein
MHNKQQILAALREQFNSWEELLAALSEDQATAPYTSSNWSIKDEIVHLWAWQQRSVARAEAALRNVEPDYPRWPETLGPDLEEDVDQTNAWIDETYKGKSWSSVYADWRAQFLRFLTLSQAIPERDLLDPGRYAWMEGNALAQSHLGSYEHHKEHLEELLARRDQTGSANVET